MFDLQFDTWSFFYITWISSLVTKKWQDEVAEAFTLVTISFEY